MEDNPLEFTFGKPASTQSILDQVVKRIRSTDLQPKQGSQKSAKKTQKERCDLEIDEIEECDISESVAESIKPPLKSIVPIPSWKRHRKAASFDDRQNLYIQDNQLVRSSKEIQYKRRDKRSQSIRQEKVGGDEERDESEERELKKKNRVNSLSSIEMKKSRKDRTGLAVPKFSCFPKPEFKQENKQRSMDISQNLVKLQRQLKKTTPKKKRSVLRVPFLGKLIKF